MKVCSICHRELPESCFHKDKSNRDNLKTFCKDCHNKRAREYNQRTKEKRRQKRLAEKKLKKELEERKQREEEMMSSTISGYKIYILNYAKEGEYRYNIVNTFTGEVINTNNREEFIKIVEEL